MIPVPQRDAATVTPSPQCRDSAGGAGIARPSGHGQARPSTPGVPAVLDSAFTPLVMPRVGEPPVDLRGEAEQARARGYAEGFAEGLRRARDESAHRAELAERDQREKTERYLHQRGSALQALAAARAALDTRADGLRALAVDELEQLALELATTILGAELSDPARAAAHAVRRAVAEMPVERWTRVVLNEQDARTVRADGELTGTLADVEVVGSPTVDAGGALVEIEDGAVDTRIIEALRRVRAALEGESIPDEEIVR